MLHHMRKYQATLTRSIILLFLISGNVSAWASTVNQPKTTGVKNHCIEQDAHSIKQRDAHSIEQQNPHAQHQQQFAHAQMQHAAHQPNSPAPQHDCCKSKEPCNKLCCNLCLVGGVPGLALFASMDIQFDYQRADFSPLAVTLPDGALSTTPYRPPQSLLI